MTQKEIDLLNVNGKEINWPICGHDHFWTRRTLMNMPGMSFFGFDFINKEAQNYVCNECGYVLWFLK